MNINIKCKNKLGIRLKLLIYPQSGENTDSIEKKFNSRGGRGMYICSVFCCLLFKINIFFFYYY